MFTLACAYLIAAGNVFFRDLGNVEAHFLRLWWFLSPGLYSLAALDELNIFKEHPVLRTLVEANPFAILFDGLPDGHLRHTAGRARPARLRVARGAPHREHHPPRVHDVRLQAARTELREGRLMATASRPPRMHARRGLRDQRDRARRPVRPAVHAARRRSVARSDRCSGAARSTSSGRCATSTCASSAGSRSRSSGPNGAGKSTLLQVLAGIIHPSEGAVDVVGHVSGLLTLGAGFDKDLTGRDNILLGGAFLGLDDGVTRELLPSIIEYAELGDFIDAPLQTYSSGMRARLGFAIATSVDPDILLLDEVLATGDANFRAKSKARVIDIVGAAKAVVLVTHDMGWVTEYCNRAILIERGLVIAEGEPGRGRRAPPTARTEEARARTAEAASRPASTRGSSRSS